MVYIFFVCVIMCYIFFVCFVYFFMYTFVDYLVKIMESVFDSVNITYQIKF